MVTDELASDKPLAIPTPHALYAPQRCHPDAERSEAEGSAFVFRHSSDQCSAVISRFAVVPIATQIHPPRVHRFDQRNLLCASPALQFLLPRNRFLDVLKTLGAHKAIAVVARREAIAFLPFVLKNALVQVTGHPDIQRPASARHDVGAVRPLMHGAILTSPTEIGCDGKNKCRSFTTFRMTNLERNS